jgi:hypothetical protein
VKYPRGLHPRHDGIRETLSGNTRGGVPESVGVHHILRLPRAGVSLHIPPRGIIFMEPNMTEGPFFQRQGWQIREKDLHIKIFKISIETILPHPPDQNICALCDHGGPWDMDNFQAVSQCEFQIFKLLD